MPNLSPDHVISFKRREPVELLPETVSLMHPDYDSTGVIRINTAALKNSRRTPPLLERLHRRRLCEKTNQLLQESPTSCCISEREVSFIKKIPQCASDEHIHSDDEPREYDAIERFRTIRERLNWLRQNNKLCDVTVQCGNPHNNFPAHRGVLVGGSQLVSELVDSQRVNRGRTNGTQNTLKSHMRVLSSRESQVTDSNLIQFGEEQISKKKRVCDSFSSINLCLHVSDSESENVTSSREIFPLTSKSADCYKVETNADEVEAVRAVSASTVYLKDWETDRNSRARTFSCAIGNFLQKVSSLQLDAGEYTEDEVTYRSNDMSYTPREYSNSAVVTSTQESNSPCNEINDFNEQLLICIKDIDNPAFVELLLEYIYTGSFSNLKTLPVDKLQKVQDLATLLKMDEFDMFSQEVMRQIIAEENVLQIWKIAEDRDDDAIKAVIYDYVSNNMNEPSVLAGMMAQLELRKKMLLTYSKQQTELYRRDTLKALLAWINKFPEQRKRFLPAILPRFCSRIDGTDIMEEFLKSDSYVEHLSPVLVKHLRWRYLLRNKHSSSDIQVCRARIPDCVLCQRNLAIASSHPASKPLHRPISRELQEKKPPPLPEPIYLKMIFANQSTCNNTTKLPKDAIEQPPPCVNSCLTLRISQSPRKLKMPSIVVLGKRTTTQTLITLKFDEYGRIGEENDFHPTLTEDSSGLTLAVYFNCVVIVGSKYGFTPVVKSSINGKIMAENLESAQELKLPPMPFSRRSFRIFMAGSTIYTCGGESSSQGYQGNVESLNDVKSVERWYAKPSMRYRRAGHSVACTDESHAFVVGGGTNRCETFSLATERWSEIAALPWKFNHCDVHVFVVDKAVVAMSSFQPLSIYILDQYMNVWKEHRLSGRPPADVISITVCLGVVYALSNKTTYYFKIAEKEWFIFTKIVRPNFEPLFLSS